MKVKYPKYPLYDYLKSNIDKYECNPKEICAIMNSINDPYIDDHMEVIVSLVIHHNLIQNNGEYKGSFDGIKQLPKFTVVNLSQNADQVMVKIICLYVMMNMQK